MEQTTVVKSRTARRTRQQIEDLINEFDAGDWNVREFCRHHSIVEGTFHKWKSRVKDHQPAKPSAFTRLQFPPPGGNSLFAEVKGVRIYQPVSAAFLKELMA